MFRTMIESKFNELKNIDSDINEHLPTLVRYGLKCNHITEMGVRKGISTWGWLKANPQRLICYDVFRSPFIDEIEQAALDSSTNFTFTKANVLEIEIEKTDLLFIDTLHSYGQLKKELELHAKQVRKYIVLHDTTSYENKNEVDYIEGVHGIEPNLKEGLWPAVEEFIQDSDWYVEERHFNNNGLTVLSRKSSKLFLTKNVDTNIILVGGGPSVLQSKNGETIDSFKKVLRYSYFKTQGFEEYCGAKTNFWWTVNKYRNEDISNLDWVFTHSFEDSQDSGVYNSFKSKDKVINIPSHFSNSLTSLVPFPSSGIVSIFWFLKFYDQVTITGFDWWKTKTQHYFNSQIRGTSHTPYIEKDIIYDLCEKGRVKILI